MTQIWTAKNSALVRLGYSAGDSFVLGTTKPDASNTGVPAGTSLTVYNGDMNITTAGTTVENQDIRGYVNVAAANVTIRNSRIRGRDTGGGFVQYGLIQCTDGAVQNLVIERCLIKADTPYYWVAGIKGSKFTATRCDISQVVDCVDPQGNNWAVDGCYLHDYAFFDGTNGTDHPSDSRFPGWTHNDGVQVSYGNNGRVKGCNIQSYISPDVGNPLTAETNTTAAGGRNFPNRNYGHGVIATPDSGVITNLVITQNWIEGGEICVQFTQGSNSGNTATVSGNRFGLDQKPGYTGNPANPYYVISFVDSAWSCTVDASSNTYDSVASVPVGLRGTAIGAYTSDVGGQTNWTVNK